MRAAKVQDVLIILQRLEYSPQVTLVLASRPPLAHSSVAESHSSMRDDGLSLYLSQVCFARASALKVVPRSQAEDSEL